MKPAINSQPSTSLPNENIIHSLIDFKDAADAWLDFYEDPTFEQQILEILEKIKPVYQQLHGYLFNCSKYFIVSYF